MIRLSASLAAGAIALALGLGSGRDPGCGGGDSPSGGENAPCTRTKDCKPGLVCSEGVCVEPDSGATPANGGSTDGGSPDAAADGG